MFFLFLKKFLWAKKFFPFFLFNINTFLYKKIFPQILGGWENGNFLKKPQKVFSHFFFFGIIKYFLGFFSLGGKNLLLIFFGIFG